jgi:ceramide glucosyltransferase
LFTTLTAHATASLAALWLAGAIGTLLASFGGALLQPALQRRRARRGDVPPVSLVLPVKLVNPGFERAQASAFSQDLPILEVLVGAAETASPAVAGMAALVATSAAPARMIHSPGIGAMSPKLDAISAPIAAANHDIIATKDSNITLSPDTLRVMLRSLGDGVGLVCAVPVAVRALSWAGRVEAVLINRDARLLLTASATGKGYGVGKVMLFRRSDLARAGGPAALAYTIAEDTALARAMATVGLRTAFAEVTVDQEIGARTLRDVYARQARWAVIRRAEEPVTFLLEPLACPLPAAVAGALAAPLLGVAPLVAASATLVGWYLLEVGVTALKRWEVAPWTPTAFIGRDLVLLAAWSRAWTTREVTWAGTRRDVRDVLRRPSRARPA